MKVETTAMATITVISVVAKFTTAGNISEPTVVSMDGIIIRTALRSSFSERDGVAGLLASEQIGVEMSGASFWTVF